MDDEVDEYRLNINETYIMSNKAERHEATAAIRKNRRALNNPVMRATKAAQDPT
jgi:hypothetical protein